MAGRADGGNIDGELRGGSGGALRAALALSGLSLAVGVALATAMWLPREPHWSGALLGALRPYLALVAIGALVLLVAARRPRTALAAGALAAFNLHPLIPLYWPAPQAPLERGPELTFVTANLRVGTQDFDALFDWLERERPDVVALQEVQASFRAAFAARGLDYPHTLFTPTEPDARNRLEMGQALLSRIPFERTSLDASLWEGRPLLEAELRVGETRLFVLATHVMRPGRAAMTTVRDAMLRGIAERSRDRNPVVLLGDLNVTATQPIFAELLASGRLRDSRRGFGWQPSWRSTVLLRGLPLDLDHVLASPELTVLDRRLGPDFGSDHRPVLVRFALPKSGATAAVSGS